MRLAGRDEGCCRGEGQDAGQSNQWVENVFQEKKKSLYKF